MEKLLTVSEVAEQCGVSTETIRRMTKRGAMPLPIRLSRSVRYRQIGISDWVAAGCPDLSEKEEE